MIFLLYKAFLLKCKFKDFFFPIIKLEVDGTKYNFYKKKRIIQTTILFIFNCLYVYKNKKSWKSSTKRRKQYYKEKEA